MTSTLEGAAGRRPAPPRDPAVDQAILDAAIRRLISDGYDAMSIEGVAADAGVGKTTIYRRYPGKRELVMAALGSLAASLGSAPDTGDIRADLRTALHQTFDVISRGGLGYAMIGTLLTKERDEPELLEQFRELVIGPRMAVATEIIRRGIERGVLRADLVPETAVQAMAGAIIAGHIAGAGDDAARLDAVLDTVWRGMAAEPG